MKILLTGTTGQVGGELLRALAGTAEVVVPRRSEFDLTNLEQIREVIRSVRPDVIVNPAAHTAVDKAESEPAQAMLINAYAPEVMAAEARKLGAKIVHYSTDYVFDGAKANGYAEEDETRPVNVYGQTKLAGEQAILASGAQHLILRTSWVYGNHGKNFMLTMLRLASERASLRIVADQHGSPTWSRTIAETTAKILADAAIAESASEWWDKKGGIYHLTCQGKTNWADFARAIFRNAGLPTEVHPITADEYPLPATRPKYSVLDCGKLMKQFGVLPQWDSALRQCQGI